MLKKENLPKLKKLKKRLIQNIFNLKNSLYHPYCFEKTYSQYRFFDAAKSKICD